MNVYFEGGFYSSKKYQKPLKRLPFETVFQWKGFTWHLLAPYVCKYGLVLDFAKQIPSGELLAFEEKWGAEIEHYEKTLVELPEHTALPEPDFRMTFENPMETELWANAWVNGREIESISGCGCAYRPPKLRAKRKRAQFQRSDGWKAVASESEAVGSDLDAVSSEYEAVGNGLEALAFLEHYQLSRDCGWYFYRMKLKWSFKRIPPHIKLRLLLRPDRNNLPCALLPEPEQSRPPCVHPPEPEQNRPPCVQPPEPEQSRPPCVLLPEPEQNRPLHPLPSESDRSNCAYTLVPPTDSGAKSDNRKADQKSESARDVWKGQEISQECLFFETETGEVGREIYFRHPLDERVHTLWLESVTQEELSEERTRLLGTEYRFPRQFQCLRYRLSEEDEGHFQIRDIEQGDAPVPAEQKDGASAVAVFLAGGIRKRREEETEACADECLQAISRLCFQPLERTKWAIDAIVVRGEEKELDWELEAKG